MEYQKLTPEMQAEILSNTILQAEADHFRRTVEKQRAESLGEAEKVEELDSELQTLEADIQSMNQMTETIGVEKVAPEA